LTKCNIFYYLVALHYYIVGAATATIQGKSNFVARIVDII